MNETNIFVKLGNGFDEIVKRLINQYRFDLYIYILIK